MIQKLKKPLVSDIKYFSMDDGPGIRTTVFMKGCLLNCSWCHNPETISRHPELAFYPDHCVGCGDCAGVCPDQAISMANPNRIDRSRCSMCDECVRVCPSTALKRIGDLYSVDQLTQILLRDRVFYDTSGGGVTFSGGEPTLHMEYVGEVMEALKRENVHIAIQTSGMFDMARFQQHLLPWIDLIYYDLKIFDAREHKKHTGRDNHLIISNFRALAADKNLEMVPRLPLIPHITETRENLLQISEFLKQVQAPEPVFLAYNASMENKRAALGLVP